MALLFARSLRLAISLIVSLALALSLLGIAPMQALADNAEDEQIAAEANTQDSDAAAIKSNNSSSKGDGSEGGESGGNEGPDTPQEPDPQDPQPTSIDDAIIVLSQSSFTYSGVACEPSVSVSIEEVELIADTDYAVVYADNIDVGMASVTITGMGNYEGTRTLDFTINPKGTSLTGLTGLVKGFAAKWVVVPSAEQAQITGYQVQVSTKKDFSSVMKTVSFAGASLTSGKISGLSKGIMYYARVRTYKTIDGKTYASAWSAEKSTKTLAYEKLVITVDAGHGGIDSGAIGMGRLEKNMTLALAKYLKAELETYENVKVYMTRTTDKYVSLAKRNKIAKKKKSDLYISLHLDSAGGAASGATVLVPGGQYHRTLSKSSQKLAKLVLKELTGSIGYGNRGLLFRKQFTRYPNGTRSDYYSAVRRSVMYGMMGILVEHGFIDSSRDMQKMNTSAKLTNVAKADARAIAKYFGLTKKDGSVAYKAQGKRTKMVTRYWMLRGGKYYYVKKNEKLLKNCTKKIKGVKYKFSKSGAVIRDSSGKKAPKFK